MTTVEEVVADFAREGRSEIWPRFTARVAGVPTSQARDALVRLAESQLLELWYVVLCENGDIVRRVRHPDPAPIGDFVRCERCDDSGRFEVSEDDVYVLFRPTELLLTLVRDTEVATPQKHEGRGQSPSLRAHQKPTSARIAICHGTPMSRL